MLEHSKIQNISSDQTRTESQKLTVGFWSLGFVFFISLDVVSKLLAHKLSLPIFYNYNFAFSIPMPTALMYSLYFIVLTLSGYFFVQSISRKQHWHAFGWVMILAGGLSNVVERILFGSVTDFIYISTGVFNIADFLILGGLLILVFKKEI